MEEPLFVVDRLGRESAGPRVLQRPRSGRRRGQGSVTEDRNGLEHRPRRLRPATNTPIKDADPDALIADRRHSTAAELQPDRLLFVSHPLVSSDLAEAREDQTGSHDERGHLGSHLGHHRERQHRQTQQRWIDCGDLSTTQGVVLRDRIHPRVEEQ